MSSAVYADAESQRTRTQELKLRILNVLPAGTYQMDRFLSLVDLTVSDEVDSAAVRVGPQPRLLLNPDFIERFCQRDEHLLMLIMHELYHVIMGHTRLITKPTEAHNIACDALINALLCAQFREPVYLEFFRNLNPSLAVPSRLLRPPKGWPARVTVERKGSTRVRELVRKLYGDNSAQVTLQDVLNVLPEDPPGADMPCAGSEDGDEDGGHGEHGGYVLIGGHDHDGQSDAASEEVMRRILREVVSAWPNDAKVMLSRGMGCDVTQFLVPRASVPRAAFLASLRLLLMRAGILTPGRRGAYGWKRQQRMERCETVLPNWRDRRAAGWEELTGEPPLLYNVETPRLLPRWSPGGTAHVYLDISGSMGSELPMIARALDGLEKAGLCKLFVFSTVVDTVQKGRLLTQKLSNTYGTDANCVFEHALSLPETERPSKIVMVTDGYTGYPNAALAAQVKSLNMKLYVGLVGFSYRLHLEQHAQYIQALPALR